MGARGPGCVPRLPALTTGRTYAHRVAAHAVPRSWVWHARVRAAAGRAMIAWGPVALMTLGVRTVGQVAAAFGVGVALLALGVAVRGPSPTEVAVAGALRTGEAPTGLSLALVDTEAAVRLRGGGWARNAWVWGWVTVVVGVAVLATTDVSAVRVAYVSAFSVTTLVSGWALTVSAREAERWRAGAAGRWAAWSAADRASAG